MKQHYSQCVLRNFLPALILFLWTIPPMWAQPTIDTDGDGITDINDLDDDNDGILDTNEGCGNLTTNEAGGTFGSTSVIHDLATSPGNGYAFANFNTTTGQYAVISQATPNWHPSPTLWDYPGHTTGTPADAYLAVNGSTSVGTFYNEVLSLISGNTYTYSMWHAAAYTQTVATGYNLQIRVTRVSDNSVVAVANTGVQTTTTWKPLSLSFTPSTSGDYRVSLVNNSIQAGGNDFSIDDIRFTPYQCTQDTDGDGIPDVIDSDSDNDGCFDALEGGAPFQGLHLDVNGRLIGSVDGNGIPLIAGSGQPLGTSADSLLINACNPPITSNDDYVYTPGTPITMSIMMNDTTGDSGLPGTLALVGADAGSNGRLKTVANEGTWSVDSTTGNLTFTPLPSFTSSPAPVQYTVIDGDGTISNPATVTLSSILPVGISYFKAHAVMGAIKLEWNTSIEINADRFEIERYTEGTEWTKIGKVTAKGNTGSIYSFEDPFPITGQNLYRLKLVDKDDNWSYSTVAKVNWISGNSIIIFPNPVNNYLTVQGFTGQSMLFVQNVHGQVLLRVDNFTGQVLDLSNLNQGIYILKFVPVNGLPISMKFMKQ
jgi:CshA-type fibril repeat protein